MAWEMIERRERGYSVQGAIVLRKVEESPFDETRVQTKHKNRRALAKTISVEPSGGANLWWRGLSAEQSGSEREADRPMKTTSEQTAAVVRARVVDDGDRHLTSTGFKHSRGLVRRTTDHRSPIISSSKIEEFNLLSHLVMSNSARNNYQRHLLEYTPPFLSHKSEYSLPVRHLYSSHF